MENKKTAQRQESKLALITPSASPPSSRPAFFPRPYRIPDQASPTKRPRLSSAPRQFQPHSIPSSSSGSLDVIDFHKAREESTMRLLDVWSGLAERYSRPLDGDDIIDITTGEVVKDRGVVRGFHKGTGGAFADPKDDDDSTEEEEEEEEEEEDKDDDELDAFANHRLNDIEVEPEGRRVPPVRAVDPRDAEDLKEFLEAERRRREVYGSEVDDTEASLDGNQTDDAYTASEHIAPCLVRDATEDEGDNSYTQGDNKRVESFYVDSVSDDELGNWERDEASIVYRLPPKVEDSDSEVEFVDPPPKAPSMSPEIPDPSPPTKMVEVTKRRNPTVQRQLQTPPQSQTSFSIPPASPDEFFGELPPSSTPPRSSSPLSSPTKPKSTRRNSSKPRSDHTRIPPATRASSTPIPRFDLTKVAGARSTKQKPQHSSSASAAPEASTSGSALHSKTKPSKPQNVSRTSSTPCEPREKDVPKNTSNAIKASPSAKARTKGKEKATSGNEQIDPSHAIVMRPKYGKVTPATIFTSTEGKKRKRVVSGAEVDSHVNEVPPPLPKTIQSRSRKNATLRPRNQSTDSESVLAESDELKEPEVKQKERRKTAPKLRAPSLEDDGDASQEENDERPQQERHFSRAPSHFGDHPYYAYPPSYPPAQPQPLPHLHKQQIHPHPHSHMFAPIPDPRAQFIITQAMHQLSALVTGAWQTPPPHHARDSTPFTPSSLRHHYPPDIPSSIYSTPTHHLHPYPYAYDSDMSRATQPPDSPEMRSSSSLMDSASHPGGGRRKSLVKRSQSRGRRVSFRLEEGVDATDISTSPDMMVKREHAPAKTRGKEMAQPEVLVSGSESDAESEIETPSRGRSKRRGQTPGPAPHVEEPHSTKQKSAATGRGRNRSRP